MLYPTSMILRSLIGRTASALLMLGLAACGGGSSDLPRAYSIGGTVTGLASGSQIVMSNNGDSALTVSANGAFTFARAVAGDRSYLVTIDAQPAGQTCSVANFQGAGVTANVSSVSVTCSSVTHTVGGKVSGLAAGQQVTLNINGADPLTVAANGAFTFAMPVPLNGSYAVTVGAQPAGETCTVSNASGSGVVADISDVAVTCSTNTFTVGGTVTGLTAGQQVTLNNNASDPVIVAADGTFTFATPVTLNGTYAVTVGTQPTGKTCTVTNGSGAGVTTNVTNVTVNCSTNTYTVGVTVSGLSAGKQVTLNNNGANPLTVLAAQNGALQTFSTPVTFNGSYAVTVGTQPVGQTCTVSNGSGSGVVANITNVTVTCSTNTYTIGVTVSGLSAGKQVTLNNNGADPLTVMAAQNGALRTFNTPVTFNGSYAVTVGTQPVGQTCTVSNGSGSGVVANINNVTVTCSTSTFTIGVTVSGLTAGTQVTLNNNGADPLTVLAAQNGVLQTFNTPVSFNGGYAVTVGTQPVGQTCTVSNGSGSGVAANIINVTVTCSTNTYTIGGTITGLISPQQVTLKNNGGDPLTLTVASGGTFTFTTPVAYGTGYAVTVGTQPTGQTCRITGGSGTNVTANVSTVNIICRLALAYVVNSTDHTVSQYTIGLDGGLTEFGTPIDTLGTDPNVVTVDPTGRFAYVTNFGSNTVAQFSIDAATGALSSLGAPLPTGSTPYSVVVDATSRYAYVTNQDDPSGANSSVSQFLVGSDGRLTANNSFTLPSGSRPYMITVDPIRNHVYVANYGTSKISQFSIDGSTGALVPMSTPEVILASGTGPLAVTIDPTGTYAYSNNFFAKTISQFSIDGTTGALTPVTTTATGTGPYAVAIAPNGSYAYWSNKYDNQVAQCVFAAAGALDCSGGLVGAGNQPQYVAIDPFSKHVYVVNFNNGGLGTISQYDITPADGKLTNKAVPTVGTGSGPFSITTTR